MKFLKKLVIGFCIFSSPSLWAAVTLNSQDQEVIASIVHLRSDIENFKLTFQNELSSQGYRQKQSVTQKLAFQVDRLNGLVNERTLVGPHSSDILYSAQKTFKIIRNSKKWLTLAKEISASCIIRVSLKDSDFLEEKIVIFDQLQSRLIQFGSELSELMDLNTKNLGRASFALGLRTLAQSSDMNEELEELEKQYLFAKVLSLLSIEFELLNNKMAGMFQSCLKTTS